MAKWSGPIGNSWRTTKDIRDDWKDMISMYIRSDSHYKCIYDIVICSGKMLQQNQYFYALNVDIVTNPSL